jgi:hypothetical protein
MEKKIEIILHEDGTIESKTYGMTGDIEMNMILNTLAHRLYELKLPKEGLKFYMSYITKSLMENITYLKKNEVN